MRKLSTRQEEVMLALDLGWFILHTPVSKTPYILRRYRGTHHWDERPVSISVAEALLRKGLIEITGVHGTSAQINKVNS